MKILKHALAEERADKSLVIKTLDTSAFSADADFVIELVEGLFHVFHFFQQFCPFLNQQLFFWR